jgi:MFS family permease
MEYAVPALKPHRQAFAAAAAVLVMASVGTLYAWSIFVEPIEARFSQSRAATSLIFSAATVAFTVGMLAAPALTSTRSPQNVALFSCLLAAAGLALSAAAETMWLIILGFGIVFGLANGFAYSNSLQVVQHAAPRRRGLFTGIAVSSYMLGTAIGSPLLSAAVRSWGYQAALLTLAAFLVAAGAVAFLLLRQSRVNESIERTAKGGQAPLAPVGEIALLWLLFFLSSLVGVMTLAHAAPMAASFRGGERHLALGVSLVALGNVAGRFAGGWLSDRLSPRILLCGAPALSAAALAVLIAMPRLDVLLASLCLVGAGYGCIAGCLPAIVSRAYGNHAMASLFGPIFTAWGVAGLAGPYLAGKLFDGHGDYTTAIVAAAFTAVAAALLGLAYTGGRYAPGSN